MVSGFLSLVRNAKSVKDSFGAKESRTLFISERAREHATIRDFPLATTTVGWVLDRTPAGPKRQCRTRSAAESCAGGLPTEDAAKGKRTG